MSLSNTNDRVATHLAMLREQVAGLVSEEEWCRFLAVQSRFHRYSFWNSMAIVAQRPAATQVAGYRRWASLGRQVRRGERGIAILAPMVNRSAMSEPESDAEPIDTAGRCVGFRVVHVFDIAQTDGDPLPTGPVPEVVTGDAPSWLWPTLEAQLAAAGFRLERGAMPTSHPSANGVTFVDEHRVVVRDGLPVAQAIKTCVHELAHVLLHTDPAGVLARSVREIEAESVAYVVCASCGLDPGGYSFPYVARWSNGDIDLVASTGARVVGCARRILDALANRDDDR